MIRIAKYLADCGVLSRRKSENLIKSGKVTVNEIIVTDLSTRINPETDIVKLNNENITFQKKTVIALNKPEGYLCTVNDDFKRKTVLDLLGDNIKKIRVYPVGRLDYNSTGLLILTNDGDLAYKITHPKFNIKKQYEIKTVKIFEEKDVPLIKNGIKIDDKIVQIENLAISYKNNEQTIYITIHEGRKRILRRIFNELGYDVKSLKRIKIGSFKLGDLRPGDIRELTEKEILQLLNNDW